MREALQHTLEAIVRRHAPRPGAPWSDGLWRALVDAGLTSLLEDVDDDAPGLFDALALVGRAAELGAPVPLADTCLANLVRRMAGLDTLDPATFAMPSSGDSVRLEGGVTLRGRVASAPWARHMTSVVLVASSESGPILVVASVSDAELEAATNIADAARDHVTFRDATPLQTAPTPIPLADLRALGALFRCAQLLGALRRVEALALEHARTRRQFGQPLSAFQAVRHNLARIGIQRTLAAAVFARAVSVAELDPAALELPVAKSRIGEAASLVAALAHQVLGAMGYTLDHELQAHTRAIWSWRDEFGTEAEWNAVIGARVAAGPDLWRQVVAA